MRPYEQVEMVVALAASGKSPLTIARETGIPRSTIKDWVAGRLPSGRLTAAAARRAARWRIASTSCRRSTSTSWVSTSATAASWPLRGVSTGCACSSTRGTRTSSTPARPRFGACSRRTGSIACRAPAATRTAPRARTSSCRCTRRRLPCLFPQHGPGRKHERRIALEEWQRALVAQHPEQLLRGLIHSDGCRFINTGRNWRHPRYAFNNRSEDILAIFRDACDVLGVHWTTAPRTVYVSRVRDVARLDEFIGPKH